MENMEKKNPLNDLMRETMEKVRQMADTNTIVGQPITTPDSVTLIPISKISFGFGSGGGDYGKVQPKGFGGGSGAGVNISPVAFLVIKDGATKPALNIKTMTPNSAKLLIKEFRSTTFSNIGPKIIPAANAPTTCGRLIRFVINPNNLVVNKIMAICNRYAYSFPNKKSFMPSKNIAPLSFYI